MRDIRNEIRSYITDNFLMSADHAVLGDDESFLDGRIVDSTGFIELVAFIEQRYGLKVEDDEVTPENLDSIAAIAAFVDRKRHG